MATYINLTTGEQRRSRSVPLNDPEWVPIIWKEVQNGQGVIKEKILPNGVPFKYLKHINDEFVEMDQAEKDVKDQEIADAVRQNKSYEQITTEIFSSFPVQADLVQVADALDTAFDVALRKRNFSFARSRLDSALQKQKITQSQYDIIDGIMPT